MTELEILKNAKACIEYLAKGIDPLTKNPVSENDVVKKTAIIKYLNFIAKVLEKNIVSEQEIQKKITNFKANEEPITIKRIEQIINANVSPEEEEFISVNVISCWLEMQGLLIRISHGENSYPRHATEKAFDYGIKNLYKKNGNLKCVMYDKKAQQWIYDSVAEISEFYEKNRELFIHSEKMFAYQPKRQEFNLTPEQKENLHPFAPEAKISEITKYFNTLIDKAQMKALKNGIISNWLLSEKLLAKSNYGKTFIPTLEGKQIGILCRSYMQNDFEHQISIFTAQAQEYIFNHIDDLIAFNMLEN